MNQIIKKIELIWVKEPELKMKIIIFNKIKKMK